MNNLSLNSFRQVIFLCITDILSYTKTLILTSGILILFLRLLFALVITVIAVYLTHTSSKKRA